MSREPLERPTIRAALFLGFGLVVAIWLFAGYYFTRRVSDIERQAAAINARYMRAQELLSTVRAQVLVGSVYVRDALLDPDPTTAANYRLRLEESYRGVDDALRQYVPVLDSSAEREQLARLRAEIADFRVTMSGVLATDPSRWPFNARTLLRTRVMPKREMVIGLSEQAQALNRGLFVQQQSALTSVYSGTQRRIWQSLGVALAASLGIALFATLYAGRLEDRIRRQRTKEVQHADELHHLSAKLITAQEEERRTIARELHDEVGQVLTAIKVELAVAQHAIESTGGQAGVLSDARSITDGALQTVRDLSHLLHPALLDDLGLPDAVAWHVRGLARRYGLRAEVLHDRMEERLTSEIEVAAYRIIQEALTNVVKHSHATSCRVYLQRLSNTLLITVEDDGTGFDATEINRADGRRGLGLIGIRERVVQLLGTLRLETAPSKGTRITVELPARTRAPGGAEADTASGSNTAGTAAVNG
jgi:signal transduction histidine kinase